MDTLFADFRHATRTLRRSPGFTLAALATLAVGIGATASIFSVVNHVILRPLPLLDPDRIVVIRTNQIERGWTGVSVAGPDFAELRAETSAFEAVTAMMMRTVEVTGQGDPAEMTAAVVSRDYFRVMPVRPLLGRVFTPDEFRGTESPPLAVVSEGFWRTQLGGEQSAIGRAVTVNGTPRTIIGVVPEAASWPRPAGAPEFYFALPETFDQMQRGAHVLEVLGRLERGASIDLARTEMATLSARQARDFPASNRGWVLVGNPVTDEVLGRAKPALFVMLGAVGFVLLIVCANVASLLVARATTRQHEIAIRRALGASPGRIVRHLVAESVWLSVGGGLLGLLFAMWGVDLLGQVASGSIPRIAAARIDGTAVAFTAGIAALTAVLCGVVPAITGARSTLQDALKDGARVAASRPGRLGRGSLVIGEIALAVVLLAGAGLMARSFDRMRSIPLGFDPTNVMAVDLDLPMSRYHEPARREQFVKQVEERIARLPGVVSVGTTRALPLESGGPETEFTIDGKPPIPQGQLGPGAFITAVTPGYFRTMGMTVVRGRGLVDADDRSTAARVVVLNETAARRYWGTENPLGQRLTLGDGTKVDVVGIVADVRQRFLTNPIAPQMFVAWSQAPQVQVSMVVRAAADPAGLIDAIHHDIWAVDPDLPVEEWTLSQLMASSLEGSKFQATLLVSFGIAALVLAAMGVYALVSYAVTQRTREIGVRMALGAARRDVVGMMLRQGSRLTIIGIAVGVVSAVLVTRVLRRVLEGLLYEVSPADPVIHVVAAGLLAVVALVATYAPARRAATVDPVVALRDER